MKIIFLPLFLVLFCGLSFGQSKHLLGVQSMEAFQQAPHAEWYQKGFDAYQPHLQVLSDLKVASKKDILIKVFFGSWCGDTKRELPKFMKVFYQAGFSDSQIELIGVDNASDTYKQSPTHEEQGMNIFRVPTFIVTKKQQEIGRMVEYPAFSFERDLLTILQKKPYQPNYAAYTKLTEWIKEGLLTDQNNSVRGLANQLRSLVQNEGELNSLGYVLIAQKKMKEAIQVLQINATLYPKVANCYDSLGEAYLLNNQKDMALAYYEYALKLDPENKAIQQAVESIKTKK